MKNPIKMNARSKKQKNKNKKSQGDKVPCINNRSSSCLSVECTAPAVCSPRTRHLAEKAQKIKHTELVYAIFCVSLQISHATRVLVIRTFNENGFCNISSATD